MQFPVTEDLADLALCLARCRPPECNTLMIQTPRLAWWEANTQHLHQLLQALCWPPIIVSATASREEALIWAAPRLDVSVRVEA